MKRTSLFAVCIALATMACNKENNSVTPSATAPVAGTQTVKTATTAKREQGDNSLFITTDEANIMINSYLSSIQSNTNSNDSFGPDVHSYSIDADSLRAILANPNVKNIKISLAHTMEYVNAGHKGENAGYKAGALTLVISGYDVQGNYQHHNNMVLDHAAPCPYTCAPGAAGASTF